MTTTNITTTNNQNFDIQQLMNIVGQSAMTTQEISNQIGFISDTVNGLKVGVGSLTKRMDNLEMNEEITTMQCGNIRRAADKRIRDMLGNDEYEYRKYSMLFHGRIYSDTRKYAGLGTPIACTKKCDYQRVVDYIEAWIPALGTPVLKQIADNKARANLRAKSMGY